MKMGSLNSLTLRMAAVILVSCTTVRAQSKSDFTRLQTVLKQKDPLAITTIDGTRLTGHLTEISSQKIALRHGVLDRSQKEPSYRQNGSG